MEEIDMLPDQPSTAISMDITTLTTIQDITSNADSEKPNLAALFLLLIPVTTVFGNLLVVMSVYREKTLRTATNYLIISMASADLLVAICVMPFAVYVEVENGLWRLPKTLCTVYTATDVCASTASILNLVAISYDRYVAVSRPLEYSRSHRKNRRVLIAIVLVWSCSLVIALPMVTGLNRLDDTPYCEFTNAVFIIVSSFVSFFVPCLVMVSLYGVVLQKLRKRQSQIRSGRKFRYSRSTSMRRPNKFVSPSSADVTANTTVPKTADTGTTADTSRTSFSHVDTANGSSVLHMDDKTVDGLNGMPSSSSDCLPDIPASGLVSSPDSLLTPTASCRISVNLPSVDKEDTVYSDMDSSSSGKSLEIGLSSYSPSPSATPACRQKKQLDISRVPFIDLSTKPTGSLPNINCNGAAQSMGQSDGNGTLEGSMSNHVPIIQVNEAKEERDSLLPIGTSKLSQNGAASVDLNRLGGDLSALAAVTVERRASSLSISALTARVREMAAKRTPVDETTVKRSATRKSMRKKAAARYSKQCRKERKATYMLAVVLVVFLACWLPFFTCHVSNSICLVQKGETCIDIVAFFLTSWLGYMNSFMNPLIYTIFNPEYRRAFKSILCPGNDPDGRRR